MAARPSWLSARDFAPAPHGIDVANAAGKIDDIRFRAGGKRNRERLVRCERLEEFDCVNDFDPRALIPLLKRGLDLIQENDAGNNRRARKMASQAWVIGLDDAAGFEMHRGAFSSRRFGGAIIFVSDEGTFGD